MKRSEFRKHFERDPEDSYAFFDRSGNAQIGMPYPSIEVAETLVQYPNVVDLHVGIHDTTTDSRPLGLMLEGWRRTLKKLEIQDFRFENPGDSKIVVENAAGFFGLKYLYDLELVRVPVSNDALVELSRLKKLRKIHISNTELKRKSIEILASSSSLKDIRITNCCGVNSDDEKLLISNGIRPENVTINRKLDRTPYTAR